MNYDELGIDPKIILCDLERYLMNFITAVIAYTVKSITVHVVLLS